MNTFPRRAVTSMFKHEVAPAAVTTHVRKATEAKSLADAYAEVDARDGGRCWVTGRRTQAGHVSPCLRREHHHLKGRRVKPEWRNRPERIVTVCAEAHALITAGLIQVEGDDARQPIVFRWRPDVPWEQRILRIRWDR